MPAHFDEQQRAATLLAAQLAGLPRVQLLQGVHRHCRRRGVVNARQALSTRHQPAYARSSRSLPNVNVLLGCTASHCGTDTHSAAVVQPRAARDLALHERAIAEPAEPVA